MSKHNQPLHRFMLTYQTLFVGPQNQAASKMVNTTISRSKKTLPLGLLKQAQEGIVMQLGMFGIEPEQIKDLTFISSSYLGLMTEAEFMQGMSDEHSAAVTIAESGDQDSEAQDPFKIN